MKEGDKISEYIRKRSTENTIAELESLAKKYHVKFFNTDDDLLVMDKKWIRKFTELYTERIFKPFGIKYLINARATSLNEEIVKMLASSGCHEVRVGVETGNEKLRNGLLDKKTSNKALINAFKTLRKYELRSMAFCMIGIPGESWGTFYDTVDMIIKLQPTLIRMTFLFPYKHTKIYDYCLDHDLFKDVEIDDEFTGSPLKFENLIDQELFCMRFLFPWYVNNSFLLYGNNTSYRDAIYEYHDLSLQELETKIPEIIIRDKELSKNCKQLHYRYFNNNETYFELKN